MTFRTRATVVVLLVVGLSGTVIPVANAYVDPGTGSMLFQVLIGAFAAAGIAIATFWRKIVGIFSRSPKTPEEPRLPE